MMSLLPKQAVAYITGAGSGIGQAIAYSFANHGIRKFMLVDVNEKGLEETTRWLISNPADDRSGMKVKTEITDVTDEAAVEKSVANTVSAFGRIDIAVNNAGIGPRCVGASADEGVTAQDWKRVVDVNLNGVWYCQRAQLRRMLEQSPLSARFGRGVIVNMASMLGTVGAAVPAPSYAASKHAVIGLTRTDAFAYAGRGIRINAICPGYVGTPLLAESSTRMPGEKKVDEDEKQPDISAADAVDGSDIMARELAKVPLGRLAGPEEIGDAATFLASEMASYMNGASLVVDGGYTIT